MLTDRIKITVRIFKKKTLRYDVCGKDCAIGDTVFLCLLTRRMCDKMYSSRRLPKKRKGQ